VRLIDDLIQDHEQPVERRQLNTVDSRQALAQTRRNPRPHGLVADEIYEVQEG
jgi:hypothetical protein